MNKFFISVSIFFVLSTSTMFGTVPLPQALKNVGVDENIGKAVTPTLNFFNEEGHPIQISQVLNKQQAVILNIVYFDCPMLCNLVLTGLVDSLKQLPTYPVGKGYQILTISMNPNDTSEQAKAFKKTYLEKLGQPDAGKSWHFWVGTPDQVKKLANQVGFNYAYNPNTKEFAHASVQILLTPEGKVARYLYGTEYKPLDLKMALIESKKGKMTSSIERLMLFCYNYEPDARGYVLHAVNLMKIGGLITIIVLGALIIRLTKKYKNKSEGLGS